MMIELRKGVFSSLADNPLTSSEEWPGCHLTHYDAGYKLWSGGMPRVLRDGVVSLYTVERWTSTTRKWIAVVQWNGGGGEVYLWVATDRDLQQLLRLGNTLVSGLRAEGVTT